MQNTETRDLPSTPENPAWVWDHDRRRIVWANDSALRFWGERSLLDLIERDFAPADDTSLQFAQLLQAALRSRVERVRTRLVLTPLGRPVRLEAIASRYALSDGRPGLRIEVEPAEVGEAAEIDRLRDIFDRTPQPISLFGEDGSLLTQNAMADYVFGAAELASLSRRYGERGVTREALRAVLVNGVFSHTRTLTTRYGGRRHRIAMRRMLDPVTGQYVALTVFNDVAGRSERLLAAGGQGHSDETALLAELDVGAAVFDDAFKPLFVSDRARRMLNIGPDAPLESLTRLFPRDRERIVQLATAIRDGNRADGALELAVRTEDGLAHWVRLKLTRGGWKGADAWVTTLSDITEERRAAVAVQRSVDERDRALGKLGIGVAALRADATFAYLSEAGARMLGIAQQGDPEGGLPELLDEDSARRFVQVFDEARANDLFPVTLRQNTRELLLSLNPADRWNRDYRIATFRAVEKGGQGGGSVLSRAETVARASHELRTPLTAILGFTQIMLADPEPIRSDAYRRYLRDIEESGTYMLRLLQDLLDLRKLEAGSVDLDPAPVDLANLVRIVARQFDSPARKRDVEITLSLEDGLPAIMLDLHSIRQALTNIVGNAVKFTASPGWVRVSLVQRASGAVELEVIDNGAGMDEDEVTKALEPFGQLSGGGDPATRGVGMGLPLAKGLVEANGARFELRSETGLGTIARIICPPTLRTSIE